MSNELKIFEDKSLIIAQNLKSLKDEKEKIEKKENVFGGGRFDFKVDEIELDMEKFLDEIRKAQEGKIVVKKDEEFKNEEVKEEKSKRGRKKKTEVEEIEEVEDTNDEVVEEEPKKRTRRSRK